MKFKFNYLENKLWKLQNEYSLEILTKYHTNQGTYGTDGFQLNPQEWITFTLETNQIRVIYQKQTDSYQKILVLPNSYGITIEFTEQDRIDSFSK